MSRTVAHTVAERPRTSGARAPSHLGTVVLPIVVVVLPRIRLWVLQGMLLPRIVLLRLCPAVAVRSRILLALRGAGHGRELRRVRYRTGRRDWVR